MLGTTLLASGQGGIACVARMTARTLAEDGVRLNVLSFLDQSPLEVAGLPVRFAAGNRLKYGAMCHLGALNSDCAVYDSVSMARAHPRLIPRAPRYAVWVHGVEVWWDLHPARKRALEGAALVLVNSQFTLDKFANIHGSLTQARVCLLGTEHDEPPSEPPRFEGPPTVLTLGRIDREQLYKGHHELIAAWPAVVAAVPDARLVLAGGGNGVVLIRETAKASPAAHAIDVLGFVPEIDVPALWRRTHVFAMPSRGEGFGLVYIEAMRQGLPVIASVHDAGQEVNVDGSTGYNVDLDEPDALTECLIELLRDPDRARQMGVAGQVRWRKRFRYPAFRERLLPFMRDF
jgi:phosphatidylinositol alpha-1,6-mannosyltransferase